MYIYIYNISIIDTVEVGRHGKNLKIKYMDFLYLKKKTYYFYWGIKTNLEKFKYQMV